MLPETGEGAGVFAAQGDLGGLPSGFVEIGGILAAADELPDGAVEIRGPVDGQRLGVVVVQPEDDGGGQRAAVFLGGFAFEVLPGAFVFADDARQIGLDAGPVALFGFVDSEIHREAHGLAHDILDGLPAEGRMHRPGLQRGHHAEVDLDKKRLVAHFLFPGMR